MKTFKFAFEMKSEMYITLDEVQVQKSSEISSIFVAFSEYMKNMKY